MAMEGSSGAATRRLTDRAGGVLLLAFIALIPTGASAWSTDAHRLVAELAEPLLTPTAKLEVDRLLATEQGSTFTSIST